MAKIIVNQLSELAAQAGKEVFVTDWVPVTQQRIDLFAEAIDDHQWIHVDRDRAARESPFGTTIAHGFLTLSLLTLLLESSLTMPEVGMGVNYGFNRVRFTSPVPAGSRIRGRFVLAKFEHLGNGVQMTWNVTVEREGADKPCLVAEWLTRRYQKGAL